MTFKDPATYDGELVCPCCFSGYPCCTDKRPDGTLYSHLETCVRIRTSKELCEFCYDVVYDELTSTRVDFVQIEEDEGW